MNTRSIFKKRMNAWKRIRFGTDLSYPHEGCASVSPVSRQNISPPTQLSITDNPRPRPQCGILAPGPAVMTGITRPLTSIKTVNTLLITELTCPENWSLIFPSISANLSCLCWSDTNWSWASARSGINDKLCSEFKQHWQFDRRAIKHDTFSLSLWWCCSGSWSDATFLIWFFRSVKYFQFPWRDDMERIDNGISSMWSHADKKPGTTRYFIFYRSGCGIRVMYICT